jgi:D-alanine-D-alanine ligase
MTRRVVVLMGGWSVEREVSLVSGARCAQALEETGCHVTRIDVQPDPADLVSRIDPQTDVIFNALHGRYGEDGCIQGILDILGIPYTHSGLLASALAMDKPMSKRLFAAAGIPVAEHVMATWDDVMAETVMDRPYVIKPPHEGSSVGVRIVLKGDNEPITGVRGWNFGDKVMVERYIEGREMTVAVLGDRALGVTEMVTDHGFLDYDAKYVAGRANHILPAEISPELSAETMRLAVLAHQTLGCRGASRADFRYDGEQMYLLEINTQPGMTPTSFLPEQAEYSGLSLHDLVTWMIDNAECDGCTREAEHG